MPADDSFGFDDDESPGPARPDAAKENPEEPVATPESRPASALLHDGELLTQGGIFDNEFKSGSEKRAEGVCHGNKYSEHRGRVAHDCGQAAHPGPPVFTPQPAEIIGDRKMARDAPWERGLDAILEPHGLAWSCGPRGTYRIGARKSPPP